MTVLISILKSKWFWIGLVALLLILVVAKNANRWMYAIRRALAKDGGDYSQGFQAGVGGDDEVRKKAIEAMAEVAYAEMNAGVTNPTNRENALNALVALNDTELRYAAKHYGLLSRDESLYAAVDGEWMPGSDADEKLMARLANMALI